MPRTLHVSPKQILTYYIDTNAVASTINKHLAPGQAQPAATNQEIGRVLDKMQTEKGQG